MSTKTALVISGGGSKGAFAVGAARYMFENLGLSFDVFSGTSTGALITPLLAAQGKDAIAQLVTEYTTVRTSDILRVRQPPESALVSSSVFTTDPLQQRMGAGLPPAVADQLFQSQKQLFLTGVNLRTGRLVYFQAGPPANVEDADLVPVRDRETLLRAMLISASIPVMMNPINYPAGGDPHVDGGVRMYAPIKAAIDAGATDIVCIVLAPRDRGPAKERLDRLTGVMQRTIDILSEEVGEGNIRMSQLYTKGAWYLQQVRERLQRQHGLTPQQVDDAFSPPNATNPFHGKRAVSLRIIRPMRQLEGGTLEFDPAMMERNLAYGAECAQLQWTAGPVYV